MSGSKSACRARWAAVAGMMALALSSCSSTSSSGPAALTWYINPDNGGQKTLAEQCSQQSGGAYTISVQTLPNDADAQREQLVRRLAANDSSIDLMSLDPPFVAEFANAGYLRAITDQNDVKALTDGVLDAPLETAKWKGTLVATPFWANTQLLWFRKGAAKAAGVDPTKTEFTWDDMIKAAESQGKKVGVQGKRYEGYMVWINALIVSGGGQIIENPEAGDKATPTVASPAGNNAADIVGQLSRSSAAPPDLLTAGEEEARALFQGDSGMFMVNWPYVYGAAQSAVKSGAISQSVVDDIGWARYPRAMGDKESAPPLGGINLGIGNFTNHPSEALAAVKCITSLPSSVQYMVEAGNPAAKAAAYDDPKVLEAFPMAPLIRDSIASAGPRPITPYYGDVSQSVQRTWHPPTSVTAPATPASTDSYMSDVLAGRRLL